MNWLGVEFLNEVHILIYIILNIWHVVGGMNCTCY